MLTEKALASAHKRAWQEKKTITLRDPGPRGCGRLIIIMRPCSKHLTAEWYASYYRGGKRQVVKIGSYPKVSLAHARVVFKEKFEPKIEGGDTSISGDFSKRSNAFNIEAMFAAYVASLEQRGARSANDARKILIGREDCAAEKIGRNVPASQVKSTDIVRYLRYLYERGSVSMADQARAYIRAAFQFGMKAVNDYRVQGGGFDWGIEYNPAATIPRDRSVIGVRNRYLDKEEFASLWRWCETNDHRHRLCKAIRVIMATGQRIEEILRLDSEMYDKENELISWSKTKNGRPHSIPLGHHVTSILDTITPNEHGLYFPHDLRPSEPAPFATIGVIIHEYLKETGTPSFMPKDMRRTWKTLGGEAGISKYDRDVLQNHFEHGVSARHYDKYEYLNEKRVAVKRWEDFLEQVLRE